MRRRIHACKSVGMLIVSPILRPRSKAVHTRPRSMDSYSMQVDVLQQAPSSHSSAAHLSGGHVLHSSSSCAMFVFGLSSR
jgi:hypothetical protein